MSLKRECQLQPSLLLGSDDVALRIQKSQSALLLAGAEGILDQDPRQRAASRMN